MLVRYGFSLCALWLKTSPAADKVNDLDLIALADNCYGPVRAADDNIIQLDSDTLFWQRKKLEEAIDVDLSGNFARFAVK